MTESDSTNRAIAWTKSREWNEVVRAFVAYEIGLTLDQQCHFLAVFAVLKNLAGAKARRFSVRCRFGDRMFSSRLLMSHAG